jgi:hypothetical protein
MRGTARHRLTEKWRAVLQTGVAAGVSCWLARAMLGHPDPLSAPVVAIVSTGAALTCADITLSTGANVHVLGKGRKERRTPLVRETRTVLKAWLKERSGAPTDPMFPTTIGKHLSRDAIERRLARHLAIAAERDPPTRS